jgi:hypothetical protein
MNKREQTLGSTEERDDMDVKFTVEDIGSGCWAINDAGRSVAYVTSQGYVDWLLKSPLENGPRLTALLKETHLCYTLGLKLLLFPPHLCETLVDKRWELLDGGRRLRLTGTSRAEDGRFEAVTEAVLSADSNGARYFWTCRSTIVCRASEPVTLHGLEFNNIYPGKCGRCFMFAADKEFDRTLMVDREGAVWEFPHQHLLHYSQKIDPLTFAEGTLAGFFGKEAASPVVVVTRSILAPTWAICDMFYDLHCLVRTPEPIVPGQVLEIEYVIKYLSDAESRALKARACRVPITPADRAKHDYPRLELGLNGFLKAVDVGGVDDASGFRQNPPQKVWDRKTGHATKGSLRLCNEAYEETVWSAEPPSQVPAKKILRIKAMVKTTGVEGSGVFIRLRYHTFVWHPTPHVEWARTLQSEPVSGTTDGWVAISVPPLEVPEKEFDYLIWFDVVLNGKGTAWVTDVEVDLQDVPVEPEKDAIGSNRRRSAKRVTAPAGAVQGAGVYVP